MITADLIQVVLQLKRSGKSNRETAKNIGISKARVEYILKKQGYVCPSRINEIEEQDNLIVSLIGQGKTYKAVALEMGLSLPLINSRVIKLKKSGRLERSPGYSKLDWTSIDKKLIVFRSQGLSLSDISKKLNISEKSISIRIAKLGLPKTVKGRRDYQPSPEQSEKDILLPRLMLEGKSAKEIAAEFQVSVVSIHRRCRRLGLQFPKTVRVIQEREERNLLWHEYSQNRNLTNRNKLVKASLNLIHRVARTFGNQAVYEDLVQEGTIGLIKAIEGFDLSLGYCFSSYAMPSIRGEMLHYFRDKHNPFKLRDEVVTCLSLDRNIRSSDSDGSPTSFMDTIPDPDGKNIEEVMSLRLAIESLDEKYRRVVELYYFKMMERKVIAKVIGVSPMTVTRYLQQSVMYLRRALN